ncbi:MAG: DNA gyrase/topoisomerase IV subunit A [Flavobacteriales bacterium]
MSDGNKNNEDDYQELQGDGGDSNLENVIAVKGMYENWFLDYASYVILERAVPHVDDGLKPVQRRVLHSMWEMEDGRYNKVANIVGNTMKYHPHGDMSIGDALVNIGQKDLLIDCQGNWGNILTGDRAAASRYIEARLTKFALEISFNPKTTKWMLSYDGRNKEPITMPMKFPLLLAQGVEGIAVGLACKMLPHNFNELIDASIARLRGRNTQLLPDFPTGGLIDASNYNDGLRGGRVRVRAKINKVDKKTLSITEIPFSTTTTSLMESIVKATEKGKIKIRNIEDNTADKVEIIIHLPAGISPDTTMDALYAFTDCEVSIAPNACVIEDDKPKFLSVTEILKRSTEQTLHLLTRELEIRKEELELMWHAASLERIFIEKKIYRNIEDCETWEEVISTIHKGLKPYVKKLIRPVTDEDVARLTEIKIKRISKFDSEKANKDIAMLEEQMKEVKHHLEHIIDYAVEYFKNLKKKYGEGRERKTEIRTFENIQATDVIVANRKLYVDKEEGFIGWGIKKDDNYVADCSEIDDIIVFLEDGTVKVVKVANKVFVGKGIIYCNVWKKGDERTIYNVIYQDGAKGHAMVKRFAVTGVTRDKEYQVTKGSAGSKVLYFSANPNGEAEIVSVQLKPIPGIKKFNFDYDFKLLAIKGRNSLGNILSKYPVKKVQMKEEGVSTLSARKIWYDDVTRRLNTEERGQFLGEFRAEDKILVILQSGNYMLYPYKLDTHFEEDMIHIEKWIPKKPISCVYWDPSKKAFNVKRFLIEPTERKVLFIAEEEGSYMEYVSTDWRPVIEVVFSKEGGKERPSEKVILDEFITVKGLKAIGNRLSPYRIKHINRLEALEPPPEAFEPEPAEGEDGKDDVQGELNFDDAPEDKE